MNQHNVSLNDNPRTPEWQDGCALSVARAMTIAAALAIVSWRLLTAYSGYSQLTDQEIHGFALRVQREWHWKGYSSAAKTEILNRVLRLVDQNPRGYLAKVWREVYR